MKKVKKSIFFFMSIIILCAPLLLSAQEVDDDSNYRRTNRSGRTGKKGVYPLHTAEVDFHFLGFLQFGPILSFRLRVIDGLLLDVHYRHAAAGVAYIALMTEGFTSTPDSKDGAIGGGFKYLFFRKHTPDCWYIGAMYEEGWGKTSVSGNDHASDNWVYTNKQRIYGANVGYRWRYKGGTFVNLGFYLGQYEVYDAKTEYDDGDVEEKDNRTDTFGFIELSIGVAF